MQTDPSSGTQQGRSSLGVRDWPHALIRRDLIFHTYLIRTCCVDGVAVASVGRIMFGS